MTIAKVGTVSTSSDQASGDNEVAGRTKLTPFMEVYDSYFTSQAKMFCLDWGDGSSFDWVQMVTLLFLLGFLAFVFLFLWNLISLAVTYGATGSVLVVIFCPVVLFCLYFLFINVKCKQELKDGLQFSTPGQFCWSCYSLWSLVFCFMVHVFGSVLFYILMTPLEISLGILLRLVDLTFCGRISTLSAAWSMSFDVASFSVQQLKKDGRSSGGIQGWFLVGIGIGLENLLSVGSLPTSFLLSLRKDIIKQKLTQELLKSYIDELKTNRFDHIILVKPVNLHAQIEETRAEEAIKKMVVSVVDEQLDLQYDHISRLVELGLELWYIKIGFAGYHYACGICGFALMMNFRQMIRSETLFVSHRWESGGDKAERNDPIWFGKQGRHLKYALLTVQKSNNNVGGCNRLQYFWMDGLSVPQMKKEGGGVIDESMKIIKNLSAITTMCLDMLILRTDTETEKENPLTDYRNRPWCVYEVAACSHCYKIVEVVNGKIKDTSLLNLMSQGPKDHERSKKTFNVLCDMVGKEFVVSAKYGPLALVQNDERAKILEEHETFDLEKFQEKLKEIYKPRVFEGTEEKHVTETLLLEAACKSTLFEKTNTLQSLGLFKTCAGQEFREKVKQDILLAHNKEHLDEILNPEKNHANGSQGI